MRLAFLPVLFLLLAANAQAAALPDLLFITGMHFGGFGRLIYSEQSKRYQLLDGRINTYVVDGSKIRLMRPDEGGGNMANPQKIVVLSGRIFGSSTFGQVNRFDPVNGALVDKFTYSDFSFSGGYQLPIYATSSALLVLKDSQITALDSDLKKIGEVKLEEKIRHVRLSPNFIQSGDRLYAIEIDNPNTYTSCARDCNFPTVIRQTTIDFSNPKAIKVDSKDVALPKDLHPLFSNASVDRENSGWLVTEVNFKTGPKLSWRSFAQPVNPKAELKLPEGTSIAAITKTAPFWLVLQKQKEAPSLASLTLTGDKLNLTAYPMPWLKGSYFNFTLFSAAGNLFVAANHQLAVYELAKAEPKLIHQQDFTDANGSGALQFSELLLGELTPAEIKTDKARLEAILKKDYWSATDQLAISAEIEKLQPADSWAIPLFAALLKNRQQSYRGGVLYSTQALAKFGPAALSTVPDLVYATMEGSSIRGDLLAPVAAAIAKIDPKGVAVKEMLPQCIAKTYVCEHVGKRILSALPER